ncbi:MULTISPECIES: 2-octaprenyl-6-methoxyphenyl hydroxylase [unclassified Halomonas]|uniref:2-octaprenyl-6-methoxyphenyl hydroxylase n=1 Tax=unclassified Halomonas TaxID=2609666 RepID=UPI0006DBA976|nr:MULTISPECIES: 2-octaprenyl-6-methoxyphenyl hydroxylase [unclassified Halomonas]KPQ20321.1 MAG: 2-octaprenyl-6-methoxyphenyl hydroxylase UbiH [Halomonas sp. HL-93]SBR52437.1 2-octaprenyl-6-methoxyphenol hydroxylase /2-octaprenyl-3-methyl-6-methoxy-1,4-benzoquinol hydroxylase [Halomonas sp. HL-93]SNY98013.1 2-octaprenyl-6-methoxyphenol hydroxylase /2-octaprenyl-3-methyl-6-methoxy-1,4-benzoquinol hydroxylase [Halomonas sp. hl-4]
MQASGQTVTHDIVIVGGGLVGASLGCALAPLIERFGWKVAIIEAAPLPVKSLDESWQPSFDARASAIAEGSAQRFRQLGVWEAMQAEATPIKRIHISERGRLGATRLNADELGVNALGHVIPNAWMGRVLHQRLNTLPLEWHCPAKVESITPTPQGHDLRLSDGSCLHGALTVLADGGRSGLKEQLGIASRREAYQQTALIAHVGVSQPHRGVAYERFTSAGPIALLPLPGQAMELIWTHTTGQEQARLALSDGEFLAQLQAAFGDRVGCFTQVGQRHSYPLNLITAEEPVRPGLAVLGNAAHALHPVAGQGFNLALRGVMDLVEALEEGEWAKRPLGDMTTLQAFERQRARDRANVIRFSDGLIRLFGLSLPLLSHARAAGLIGLNIVGPLRKGLARRAMGLER